MPTYQYLCDIEEGGCGDVTEVNCLMSERDEKQPKSCPNCRKRKPLRQLIGSPTVSIPTTLGVHADKQSSRMSDDEKHHIKTTNEEYKKPSKSWISTPNGMVHK